jgi:uncharacterized membrane protein YqhA
LSITSIVAGLALMAIGIMLNYFDITGAVTIVGLYVNVIGLVLFAIVFVIIIWGEY